MGKWGASMPGLRCQSVCAVGDLNAGDVVLGPDRLACTVTAVRNSGDTVVVTAESGGRSVRFAAASEDGIQVVSRERL